MWRQIWDRTFNTTEPAELQLRLLHGLICAGTACLILATWKLWWGNSQFPQVPWFRWGCGLPQSVDHIALAILGISLILASGIWTNQRVLKLGEWCFIGSGITLMLLSQQRTQPWMYQLIVMTIILALAPPRSAFALLRFLTVAIYLHSGLSKLDATYSTGLGWEFWKTLLRLVRDTPPGVLRPNAWPLIFPAVEILISLLLCFPATRRWGVAGACLMHAALLLILGPWGLNHHYGVLTWNVVFILLLPLLFLSWRRGPRPAEEKAENSAAPARRAGTFSGTRMAQLMLACVTIWPFSEPWRLCDTWLSWGLYAEHGEQLTIAVSETGLRKLPGAWQERTSAQLVTLDPEIGPIEVLVLYPKEVSLRLQHAPVYPSNRFLLGVALDLAARGNLGRSEILAIQRSRADRWTGQRTDHVLKNLDEVRAAADSCHFNAPPR